jgi:hypothetical protein
MAIFLFPTYGLALVIKKTNPTTSVFATCGRICFSPRLLNHAWGMKILPICEVSQNPRF